MRGAVVVGVIEMEGGSDAAEQSDHVAGYRRNKRDVPLSAVLCCAEHGGPSLRPGKKSMGSRRCRKILDRHRWLLRWNRTANAPLPRRNAHPEIHLISFHGLAIVFVELAKIVLNLSISSWCSSDYKHHCRLLERLCAQTVSYAQAPLTLAAPAPGHSCMSIDASS